MNQCKARLKMYKWILKSIPKPMSLTIGENQEYYYVLIGISNQYAEGRHVVTSNIVRIDFEKNECETQNTIYELCSGNYPSINDINVKV